MGIAFMTANFAAKEINYAGKRLLEEWEKCHNITSNSFHGPDFEEKFERLIADVSALGFRELELWNAHFNPLLIRVWQWEAANKILKKYNMRVISLYTDAFRDKNTTAEEAHMIFWTAKQLGADKIVQSGQPADRNLIVKLCNQYDIDFGIENHPEKNPEEILKMIGSFSPSIGACIDTGWFATQGCNPVEAVRRLSGHIVHIHLKDILAVGEHETCAIGDGIVDFSGLFKVLREIDYHGTLSIEHEPIDFDPAADIKKSLTRLEKWLANERLTS